MGSPHSTRDDGPPIGPEPHEHHAVSLARPLSVRLARQLADVHHAGPRHVRVARVTNVSVVLPHDGLRLRPVVRHEAIERVGHVMVSHVP